MQTHYLYMHLCVYIRVSQPQHYCHLGPDNSLLLGVVLCIVGCLTVPLDSTHLMSVAALPL